MNRLPPTFSLAPFLLVLTAPLTCQAATVPPGYLTRAASGVSDHNWLMTSFPDVRAQIGNRDIRALGPRTIRQISFRQTDNLTLPSATSRRWSRVVLKMAETDIRNLSTTWTANYLTTPTTVFAGSHDFPDLTRQPPGSPNPWFVGGLRFPFQSSFSYTARRDLLLNLRFMGGTMANGAPWGPAAANAHPYYIDGVSNIRSQGAGIRSGGRDARRFPCVRDSSSTRTTATGPDSLLHMRVHAKKSGDPRLDDKLEFYRSLRYFPPNRTVLQAISLAGTTSVNDPRYPIVPGLGCQNLMIDLRQLVTVSPFRTDARGYVTMPKTLVPFVPTSVGMHLHTQAIWNDTVTGQPKLSRASDTTVPPQPEGLKFDGTFAYHYVGSSRFSFGPGDVAVPLFRVD